MSTIAAEVFDQSPYATPEADLRIKGELVPDRLFSTEGRVGVMRYNARLFQSMLLIAMGAAIIGGALYFDNNVIAAIAAIPSLILMFAGIALLVYSAIKRLHDLNFSGWFYLIGMIPILGTFWALYYSLVPGKKIDNKYGPIREATKGDKIMGVFGIALFVLMMVASLIPSSYL